ncbi:MAG: hypothetical protein LW865_14490 [Betaproteobacteria bacterium]|jgi:hypothetical protein|nr:hypothetical protein [Betaproteobacteria bacterium]
MKTLQLLDQDTPECAINDVLMAKQIALDLDTAYPGHLWAVTCDGRTGIATVRNLRLSGRQGFILRLPEIYSASDFKKSVLKAGGEILERYHQPRGVVNIGAIAGQKTDFAGNKLYDR